MLIVMRTTTAADDLVRVKRFLIDRHFDFHQSTGANRVILGIIGDAAGIDQSALRALPTRGARDLPHPPRGLSRATCRQRSRNCGPTHIGFANLRGTAWRPMVEFPSPTSVPPA